jgi:hypothetical protein
MGCAETVVGKALRSFAVNRDLGSRDILAITGVFRVKRGPRRINLVMASG